MSRVTYAHRDASDEEKLIAMNEAVQARKSSLKFSVWLSLIATVIGLVVVLGEALVRTFGSFGTH